MRAKGDVKYQLWDDPRERTWHQMEELLLTVRRECLRYLLAQVIEQNLLEPRNCSAGAYFPQYSHFRRFAFLSSSEKHGVTWQPPTVLLPLKPSLGHKLHSITLRDCPQRPTPRNREFKFQNHKGMFLKNIIVFLILSQTISILMTNFSLIHTLRFQTTAFLNRKAEQILMLTKISLSHKVSERRRGKYK